MALYSDKEVLRDEGSTVVETVLIIPTTPSLIILTHLIILYRRHMVESEHAVLLYSVHSCSGSIDVIFLFTANA